MEKINWYPGHMKKTRELIQENMKLVDLVVEIIDARIPLASRNPVIGELIKGKPSMIVLNKRDLADPAETDRWIAGLAGDGVTAVSSDAEKGDGIKPLLAALSERAKTLSAKKKWERPMRLMIAGVPNVGKSSLINRLTGRKAAKTGDRPGVTKGKQWLTIEGGMQLLDTPGILWPNIDDPERGKHLAFCGSIKDEIYDISDLALELIAYLYGAHRSKLLKRYGFTEDDAEERLEEIEAEGGTEALAVMDVIAKKRGFLLPGKRIDYERCARTVLDEFRSGIIGRITLEKYGESGR